MAEKRRRRRWSDKEKSRIIAQTQVSGISVSQVARRYDVNANLVFTWLRDPRFCKPVGKDPCNAQFLPVEVSQSAPLAEPVTACSGGPGKIEISLANGHHLSITGGFDADAVKLLLKGLT